MTIDYEKAFNKLVEQIDFEYGLAQNECSDSEFKKGMMFAYGSTKRLAEKLETGEFDFEEEQGYFRNDEEL